ncbi:hypothetical protein GH714_041760 [Hevea brasiliensis]|uniref:DCD domain-containing protein n=1 Tax=Hevea brasiliensis TaxID=3981 RepID=A0A6A6MWZ3_HEVBR|nr:hypothetical protein GH714_041760 [Hevea brasiliensis]
MDSMQSFWQLGDELRGQSKVSEDHKWLMAASKLAEQTRSKGERMNNLDLSKMTENVGKSCFRNGVYNMNAVYQKNNINNIGNLTGSKYSGLPPRYRDSVRAITPGLPLFLYNYTTHQLHGSKFWGSNIDPTAWEDKKCKGESRFPAQVRICVRKLCKALEEDAFRPVLHHYDGPKFRLELSVPETLDLLDLCEQAGSPA